MFRTSLLVASLVVLVNGQGCSVCGDGKTVGNPAAIFAFPGQPSVPCADLQTAGESGLIPLDQCGFLAPLITACECQDLPSNSCPAVPEGGCSVCGEVECVQKPDALFVFPGQPEVTCSTLQGAGYTGAIPLDQCGFLAGLIGVCECGSPAPIAPSSPPTPLPTPAPTDAPTPAPVAPIPAEVPTGVPTLPPTSAPTPVPIFVQTPAPTTAVDANVSGGMTAMKSSGSKMGMDSTDSNATKPPSTGMTGMMSARERNRGLGAAQASADSAVRGA